MKKLARWYFNRRSWQMVIVGLLAWPVGVLIIAAWIVWMILVMPVAAVETFLEDSRR
jgi:hypothetical protein